MQAISQKRIIGRQLATTLGAVASIAVSAILVSRTGKIGVALLGSGLATGCTTALIKRAILYRCGREDQSLLGLAHSKAGTGVTWLIAGTALSAALTFAPLTLTCKIALPLTGLILGEHLTNRTITPVRQLPCHAADVAKTARFLCSDYPELKFILPGIGALACFALLPGSLAVKASALGGLAIGMVAIGFGRKALQSRTGRDIGEFASTWNESGREERIAKAALGLSALALIAAGVTRLLVVPHSPRWLNYLLTGTAGAMGVQLLLPSLPPRMPRALQAVAKKVSVYLVG